MSGIGRGSVAVACAALGLATVAPPASADADPASDYLITQAVFLPYSSQVSRPLAKQLTELTASAKKSGLPLKVALIGSPGDLGGVPDAFGRPQQYARFLGKEISFNTPQPLLVVMPQGYGLSGLPPKASEPLKKLPPPGGSGDSLARQAVIAIPKVATATGHEVAVVQPAVGSSGSSGSAGGRRSGGGTSLLVFLLPLLLLGAAAAGASVLNRRRAASEKGDAG